MGMQFLKTLKKVVPDIRIGYDDKINIAAVGIEITECQRSQRIHPQEMALQESLEVNQKMVKHRVDIGKWGWMQPFVHSLDHGLSGGFVREFARLYKAVTVFQFRVVASTLSFFSKKLFDNFVLP